MDYLKQNFLLKNKFIFPYSFWATIFCLISFILIIANNVKAETTSGTCTIKDDLNGNNLYELRPGIYFEVKPEKNGWHRILLKVWVQKKFTYSEEQILHKAKLFDENRKQIGIAINDFTPYKMVGEIDSMYCFQLSGYIDQNCIDANSVPENNLNTLLSSINQNAKLDTFGMHFKKFPYSSFIANNKFQSYILTEPDFILQKNTPRILIVFYEQELIAIFYSREVKAKYYDSIEMGSEYKLIYNSKFTEKTKTEMLEIFRKKVEEY